MGEGKRHTRTIWTVTCPPVAAAAVDVEVLGVGETPEWRVDELRESLVVADRLVDSRLVGEPGGALLAPTVSDLAALASLAPC